MIINKLQRQKIRFSTFSSGLLTEVSVIRNFAPPKFRKFCPTRLKGQKLLAQGNGYNQHALKGQKLLAQGNALGIKQLTMRPVRAKALKYRAIYKAFALTGRQVCEHDNPGRCPGLRASAPSGRAAYMGSSYFRAYWVIPTVQFEKL